jgi:DNA-directed RNA polymerase specialized sigma24 family protein
MPTDKNRAIEKSFLEMHDSFSDEIFRFCLSKTRNRDLALDITQETFIKTWDLSQKW